jgi:hypothetical protein
MADLRDWRLLEEKGTAFDAAAHTVDVREVRDAAGRYNIPNIGIFLWRIGSQRVTDVEPFQVAPGRYHFDPLGIDAPLFNRAFSESLITHIATPDNVPRPISHRHAYEDLERGRQDSDYDVRLYGSDKSFTVLRNGQEIDVADVRICDLSDQGGAWAHEPTDGIAIDPELGRIAFPAANPPNNTANNVEVTVLYHYGRNGQLGGGGYDRSDSFDLGAPDVSVARPDMLQPAIDQVLAGGVVEVSSGRYTDPIAIAATSDQVLVVRSANEHRADLILGADLTVTSTDRSTVELNGLRISGAAVRVPGSAGNRLAKLVLRDCTLVPGITVKADSNPASPDLPSVVVEKSGVTIELQNCIVGGIRVVAGSLVTITNSIVDATGQGRVAYAAVNSVGAGGELSVKASTIIGKIHTRNLGLVSNSILAARTETGDGWSAPVISTRKQDGCVRFSYVPPDAWVPRRYRVQPNLAIRDAIEQDVRDRPGLSDAEREQRNAQIYERVGRLVRPVFTSRRYGDAAYCQLARTTPAEIRSGADDESEMGAFHQLYEPQRIANLKIRLDEYLRFGLEAGVFLAS